MRLTALLLLLPLHVCLLAAAGPGLLAAEPPALELGRTVYNFRCYYCHGYSGDARTLAARFLKPPPRDFTQPAARELSRQAMIDAVTRGRPGTAMEPFGRTLSAREIEAVVDFVRETFITRREANTQYHTAANGWPDHERYKAAFPFATGALPVDAPWETLDDGQRAGKRLFLASCVSCHDRSHVTRPEVLWERQALSFPRFGFQPGDAQRPPDAISGASPFARHDIPPVIPGLTPQERAGEAVYQGNCAFCHAADGTAQNWIGRFMEPHPRDLTSPEARARLTPAHLRQVIRHGLPGTSMPAWRHVLSDAQIDALIAYLRRAFLDPPKP